MIERLDPATSVLYSSAVEPLFMPNIWLDVPEAPNPVPPLVNANAVARVKDEADKAPVNVPPPWELIPKPVQSLPLTPIPPVTTSAPVVEDVEFVLLLTVRTPRDSTVDLNIVAPVTPNPAATSNVEPIIVAPEIFPVPNTTKVDLKVVAPVTPNPAATSKVEPIIVAPEILPVPNTTNVDLSVVAPVTPNPAATSNVEPIIVAPEILPVPVNTALPVNVLAPAMV